VLSNIYKTVTYKQCTKMCNVYVVYSLQLHCAAGCTSQMDVTLILDRSDYLEPYASAWVVSVAKQLIYGLPVESRRSQVAVITYADTAVVNFELDKYSKTTDMINEMSFGYMGSRSHLQVTHSPTYSLLLYRQWRSSSSQELGIRSSHRRSQRGGLGGPKPPKEVETFAQPF